MKLNIRCYLKLINDKLSMDLVKICSTYLFMPNKSIREIINTPTIDDRETAKMTPTEKFKLFINNDVIMWNSGTMHY